MRENCNFKTREENHSKLVVCTSISTSKSGSQLYSRAMKSTELLVLLLLLLGVVGSLRGLTRSGNDAEEEEKQEHEPSCPGSSSAEEAMRSTDTLRISRAPGIGLTFLSTTNAASPLVGGPNVTRGIVILPETGVAPEAYAPHARAVALSGYYAVVVENATVARVIEAMMQQPQLQYWTLAGHGEAGAVAARLALTLHPKVKALVLLAAALPEDVSLVDVNLLLIVVYGSKDTVVPPATVEASFSRMEGDTKIVSFPQLGHYDFASSLCSGNEENSAKESTNNNSNINSIAQTLVTAVALSHWPGATARALSYTDNEKLTPGHNDSKPYLGDIRVQFTELPIPDTSPQRLWWVFTPTRIKGGLIYYTGAAIDGRAYASLAFEIAARGYLVVIVQQPNRIGSNTYADANVVLNSKDPIFSGVPKDRWALGGHSAGGFASTLYLSKYPNKLFAVVMHAGGWAGNLTQSPTPVAQIYGTLDGLSPGGYDRYRYLYVDPPPKGRGPLVNLKTSKFITIAGGTHFQVGDYEYYKTPDPIAIISHEQQHVETAIETIAFLDSLA